MAQRDCFEREEYLTAKALYMAIRIYDLYPDEIRPDDDQVEMGRILRERFPQYAYLLSQPVSDVMVV